MIKTCEECRVEYTPKNNRSKFCSASCRVNHYNKRVRRGAYVQANYTDLFDLAEYNKTVNKLNQRIQDLEAELEKEKTDNNMPTWLFVLMIVVLAVVAYLAGVIIG